MLRIICVQSNYGAAANVGGPVCVTHKTFLVDCPEVESWLSTPKSENRTYEDRSIVGVEVVASCRFRPISDSRFDTTPAGYRVAAVQDEIGWRMVSRDCDYSACGVSYEDCIRNFDMGLTETVALNGGTLDSYRETQHERRTGR